MTPRLNQSTVFHVTNLSDNPTEERYHRSYASVIVGAAFLFIILFISVFGNATVIAAVTRVRRLRREKLNVFIINLAVTDLTSALIVMTSAFVALVEDEWNMGAVWCDIVCATNYLCIIVSMLSLCFISVDRYHAILKPFDYNTTITRFRVYCMVGYAWFQGVVFAMAPAICGWVDFDYTEVICAINWSHPEAVYYVITAFLMCFMGPAIIMVFCYFKMLHTVTGMEGTQAAIRSLLIMLAAFFLCMTPFCVTKLIKVLFPNEEHIIPPQVNMMASWIGYLSSAVNPLIYSIFRKDFRMAFLVTFHRICFPHVPLTRTFNENSLAYIYTQASG